MILEEKNTYFMLAATLVVSISASTCLVVLCVCVVVCPGEDCLTLARSYDDDELSELVQSKVDRKHQHKEQKGNSGGTSKKTPQDPPQVS